MKFIDSKLSLIIIDITKKPTYFFNSLLLEIVLAASFVKLIVCLFNQLTSKSLLWTASFSHCTLPGRCFFSRFALYKDFLFFCFLLFSSSMAVTSQARSWESSTVFTIPLVKKSHDLALYEKRRAYPCMHAWSLVDGAWFLHFAWIQWRCCQLDRKQLKSCSLEIVLHMLYYTHVLETRSIGT